VGEAPLVPIDARQIASVTSIRRHGAVRRTPQWYESAEGRLRLKFELDTLERFNSPRRPELRLKGKRHAKGHFALSFAFQPLAERQELVRGELIYSSRHPEIEPLARIDEPALVGRAHVLPAEIANEIALGSIPTDWIREADGRMPCMWSHDGSGTDGWNPSFTATTAVLNVQSWFLNYVVWRNSGTWPYDRIGSAQA
jgi:hypothetical protein